MVELERNRPIEVLPDRQVETVAPWLAANPGIVIAARDGREPNSMAAR
jgi:hypothetical protein